MKVLFVGDIVGSPGRKVVIDHVPSLREKHNVDLVIANAENSAHGKGITFKIYEQLLKHGVDVITMGNHTFSKEMLYRFIDDAPNLIRPANMFPLDVGQNYKVVLVHGKRICITNILCEVFMYDVSESPFVAMQKILDEVEADIYFVDLHGEATSEKLAFAHYFKDKVQCVLGTHTHVQTADEQLLGDTCAYISDVGMCGAYHSIIGRDIEEVLTRFTTDQKTRFTVGEGEGIFCGALIGFDDNTLLPTSIERIQIRPKE